MKRKPMFASLVAAALLLTFSAGPAGADVDERSFEELTESEQLAELEVIYDEFPPLTESDADWIEANDYRAILDGSNLTMNPPGKPPVTPDAATSLFYCAKSSGEETQLAQYKRTKKTSMSAGTNVLRCGNNFWGFRHIEIQHWKQYDKLDTYMSWDLTMDKNIAATLAKSGGAATYQPTRKTYLISAKGYIWDYRKKKNVGEYTSYVVVADKTSRIITAYPSKVKKY